MTLGTPYAIGGGRLYGINSMNARQNKSVVAEIDEKTFQSEVLSAKQFVLVVFLASWSHPCQILAPVVEAVATASSGCLHVFKVNVDNEVDLGMNYEIQSVPTLLGFLDGKECLRIIGTATKEAILSKLMPFLPSGEAGTHSEINYSAIKPKIKK